jgi:hypothetical protein
VGLKNQHGLAVVMFFCAFLAKAAFAGVVDAPPAVFPDDEAPPAWCARCSPYNSAGQPSAIPLNRIPSMRGSFASTDTALPHDSRSSGPRGASAQLWMGGNCDERFQSGTIENKVCRYSSSAKVKDFLNDLKSRAVHGYSHHQCKAYVRLALEHSGLLKPFPNTKDPRDFAEMHGDPDQGQLAQQGFVNLLDPKFGFKITKPSDAPPGAVLVYAKDGYGHYGHVEARTDEEGHRRFASDFSNHNAFTHDRLAEGFPIHFNGSPQATMVTKRLIGVFVNLNE